MCRGLEEASVGKEERGEAGIGGRMVGQKEDEGEGNLGKGGI